MAFLRELRSWGMWVLAQLPGVIGLEARRIYWGRKFKSCGEYLRVGQQVTIVNPEGIIMGNKGQLGDRSVLGAKTGGRLEIGDGFCLGGNSVIDASYGSIIIGDGCLISKDVYVTANSHSYKQLDYPIRYQGHIVGEVVISDYVYIGVRAVILPGVTVGKNAIVGAGAVVTHDVKDNAIVGGVPARVIKHRANKEGGIMATRKGQEKEIIVQAQGGKILEVIESGFDTVHRSCITEVSPYDRLLFEGGMKEEARRVIAFIDTYEDAQLHIRVHQMLRYIRKAVETGDLPE